MLTNFFVQCTEKLYKSIKLPFAFLQKSIVLHKNLQNYSNITNILSASVVAVT